jgi:hypothetical protein
MRNTLNFVTMKASRHMLLCYVPEGCNWNVYFHLLAHYLYKLSSKCDKPFRIRCTLGQKRAWCVCQHSTAVDCTAEWHVKMPWTLIVDGMNWKNNVHLHLTMTLFLPTGSRVSHSVLCWQTLVSHVVHTHNLLRVFYLESKTRTNR